MGFFLNTVSQFAQRVAESGGSESLRTKDRDEFAQNAAQSVPAHVTMFSGCQDSQTSADVYDVASFGLPPDCGPAGAGGACTHALLKYAYSQDGNDFTWKDLLVGMREILKSGGYTQIPQLSSSRQLELDTKFELDTDKASGGKRALLIGINYVGQQGELRGCHNDVNSMLGFLERSGFKDSDCQVRILRDNGHDEEPTRDNILAALKWLGDGVAAGDTLFLHYSGHGSRVRDTDSDEKDGYDETMVPLDYEAAGQITDDMIHRNLVLNLPEGASLTAVMDCCHSGSIFDLPYTIAVNGEVQEQLQSGMLNALFENNSFFGNVLKTAMRYASENPEATKQLVGAAVGLAQNFGIKVPKGLGGLFG